MKVHSRIEGFTKELAAYERLGQRGVTDLLGFAVPRLVRADRRLRVIEMSIVRPPFLLDFAAATLDDPRDFTDEALEMWWDKVRSDFGDDFEAAEAVYWTLANQYGIYYWDLKPRNLRVR